MSDAEAVLCPRCRYDLRAATSNVCPECGLEVSLDDLRARRWRRSEPSGLDRADLWQPHQILLRSLWEIVRGALWPRRVIGSLDAIGSLARAAILLVIGAAWVWVICSAIIAGADVRAKFASPGTAVRATLRYAGLELTGAALVAAAASYPLARALSRFRNSLCGGRAHLRLLCYRTPAVALYLSLPNSVSWLISPDWMHDSTAQSLILFALLVLATSFDPAARPEWRSTALGVIVFAAGLAAAWFLLPRSIVPPIEFFF